MERARQNCAIQADALLFAGSGVVIRQGYFLTPVDGMEQMSETTESAGDAGTVGALATRLAGSFDIFEGPRTRSVNFIAAHDGTNAER